MSATDIRADRFDWMLNEFAERVPGVVHAVAVSSDGLLLAHTHRLSRERAGQLAAMASGLTGLSAGASRCLGGGPVSRTIVEMDGGTMIVMVISDGSSLAVLASPTCEIGLVGYEMTLRVARAGRQLTPELRRERGGVVPGPAGDAAR